MRTYSVLGSTESHNRCLGALILGDLSTQDMSPPGIGSLDTEESLGESMRSRRSPSARSTASSAYDACRAVFVLRSMVCGVERRRKHRGVRRRFSVGTGSHCLMVYSVLYWIVSSSLMRWILLLDTKRRNLTEGRGRWFKMELLAR
jgi:hypothetical protein